MKYDRSIDPIYNRNWVLRYMYLSVESFDFEMCRLDGLAVHVVGRLLLCLGVTFRGNVTHILVDLGLDLDAAHLGTGDWDLLGLEGAASAGGAALGQLAVDDVGALVQLDGLQGDSVVVLVVLILRLLLGLHDGV